MREWKALFISGQSLYDESTEQVEVPEPDQEIEEAKLQLLDEEDFKEYKVRHKYKKQTPSNKLEISLQSNTSSLFPQKLQQIQGS